MLPRARLTVLVSLTRKQSDHGNANYSSHQSADTGCTRVQAGNAAANEKLQLQSP